MARFLTQRLVSSFVSIIGATLVIFLLVQLHNDPRELYVPDSGYGLTEEQWEMLGEKMGFNDPLPVQYWNWISGAFLGDFGVSLAQQVPVRDIIQNRMRATIELAIGGWAFAILLGIPTGVLAAVKRGTFWDYIARGVAIIGQGAPPFVIGLLLIVIFAVWLQDTPFELPAAGRPPQFNIKTYILPCIALGWPAAAGLMRLTRSAMLEVLDPEQNNTFNDHYLEVDYDLSEVMFICTANSLSIPPALLDRMEIIRLPGYIEDEKLNIAKNYLVPRNLSKNGLKNDELIFSDNSILKIIRNYTREAGVRSLDRELNKICRKKVKEISLGSKTSKNIDNRVVRNILGPELFDFGQLENQNSLGQVNGLAWTSVGGELLKIEAALTKGKGRVTKTGSLGDVMQESIQAALTVVKNISNEAKIKNDFFEKHDLHIHVPEGATPKDGPSAGITMCTAISSVVLNKKVKGNLAMTGEITLGGKVLKIGGLKEKLIAAKRSGITNVIIPKENVGDLEKVEKNILKNLKILPVKKIEEVLEKALVK